MNDNAIRNSFEKVLDISVHSFILNITHGTDEKKKEQKDEHVPVPAFKEFTRSWETITINISLDFYSFQKMFPMISSLKSRANSHPGRS